MYKLTIISGPNRGSSYALQEGEHFIGRQSENSVILSSSKVSKRHCSLTVGPNEIVLKDQGSSNGTFVNGILTKVRKINPGDKISIGEFVLEVTAKKGTKAAAAPSLGGMGAGGFGDPLQSPGGLPGNLNGMGAMGIGEVNQLSSTNTSSTSSSAPPKDIKGKIIWYFEHHLMPIFYSFNIKHEWNVICIALFAVFVVGSLLICVYPLLESNRVTIVKETGKRARFMAKQIAEQNASFLAAHAETKTEIGIVENAEGVRVALLTDLENRIIAPGNKLNQYLASGVEANVAINARKRFLAGGETGFWIEADSETVVAIEPVKVLNPAAGRNVVVAMAVVSIDTSLAIPDMGEMGMIYSEALILTGILGGLILLILYRLTLRPLHILNEDMDKALKGDITQVTHEYKIQELNPLWDIINSAIQRISTASDPSGSANAVDSATLAEEFTAPLRLIGSLDKFGLVVLNSDKKIVYLNPLFEEMSGIRSDGAIGQELSEVARDQAMGAFTNDIISRTPVGGEAVTEDYDFSGITYKISVASFGAAGSFAKCTILVATKAEG